MIVIINSYNIEEIGIKKKINTRKEIIIKIIIF